MHNHNASRIIRTTGLIGDGHKLQYGDTYQVGFPHWVHARCIACSFCGGDLEGRCKCPRWLPNGMPILHEAVGRAVQDGADIRAGALYAFVPGRRPRCVAHPYQGCPFGQEGCEPYANRGTSRFPGYGTADILEDPAFMLRLPDAWGAEYGSLVEPLAICAHAVRVALQLGRLPTERVGVLGLGGLGLMLSGLLVDVGVEVVGHDIHPSGARREAFEALGSKAMFAESWSQADRLPLVFEMAGTPRSWEDAVDRVDMGGAALLLGISMGSSSGPSVLQNYIVTNAIQVQGVVSAEKIDFQQAISALSLWTYMRAEFLSRLVTHRLPVERFEDVFKIEPKDRVKVVLTFED